MGLRSGFCHGGSSRKTRTSPSAMGLRVHRLRVGLEVAELLLLLGIQPTLTILLPVALNE